jgi:hypothetical protein
MNIAMEQTEEYVNGQLKNKYGDAFIRGNNGTTWISKPNYLNVSSPENYFIVAILFSACAIYILMLVAQMQFCTSARQSGPLLMAHRWIGALCSPVCVV